MAITIKSPEEIAIMRESGKILAATLEMLIEKAVPGTSTAELDRLAEDFIRAHDAKPSFKGFQGYPATICTGINEVIVHGIPRPDEIIKEGDLITIDCGVEYRGFHTDAARTKLIGQVSPEKTALLKTAEIALSKGIDQARVGNRVSDISKVIQETVEKAGFHIIYELTGHGIGREMHEDPIVLNYDDGKEGPILKSGTTIAIEPIFSVDTSRMKVSSDNWTIKTATNSCAVQLENTVLISEKGPEVLTQ